MLIVERVVDAPPLPPAPDDALRPHQPQLVRHRRFADADLVGNLVDAELPLGEGVDDAHSGRISEDAEGLGQGLDSFGVRALDVS